MAWHEVTSKDPFVSLQSSIQYTDTPGSKKPFELIIPIDRSQLKPESILEKGKSLSLLYKFEQYGRGYESLKAGFSLPMDTDGNETIDQAVIMQISVYLGIDDSGRIFYSDKINLYTIQFDEGRSGCWSGLAFTSETDTNIIPAFNNSRSILGWYIFKGDFVRELPGEELAVYVPSLSGDGNLHIYYWKPDATDISICAQNPFEAPVREPEESAKPSADDTGLISI